MSAGTRKDARRHPRVATAGAKALIGHNPGLHLIDISAEWVEFYAQRAYPPGQRLQVQVDSAPPCEGEVVACMMEETDPRLLDVHYRVRCRFLREGVLE